MSIPNELLDYKITSLPKHDSDESTHVKNTKSNQSLFSTQLQLTKIINDNTVYTANLTLALCVTYITKLV